MMTEEIHEVEYELFESQSQIIALQEQAIIQLVSLLSQLVAVDYASFAPIKELIDEAAAVRAEHNL